MTGEQLNLLASRLILFASAIALAGFLIYLFIQDGNPESKERKQ